MCSTRVKHGNGQDGSFRKDGAYRKGADDGEFSRGDVGQPELGRFTQPGRKATVALRAAVKANADESVRDPAPVIAEISASS